jgi:RNA polymerase sigma factor (sigma-70 family)
MSEYSDKDLMKLYREGANPHYAFNLIVEKYKERLYWHIRKIVIIHDDADDVMQNTFIKVWKGLAEFREESQLFTWIYRIATNEALTHLKQKRNRYLIPIVDVEQNLSKVIDTDSWFNGDELQKKLQKAILSLPEKQRLVFNMKYFDELKYEEIAEILGTSVGALKASYHLAVKKIEKYIEAH